MTSLLTLRQIQVRSTLATLPFLIPILYGLSYFLYIDLENSSIQFFLRASLGLILTFFICWKLCPLPTSPEFKTAGISQKSVVTISTIIILEFLIDLLPDTIAPTWINSEAGLFVSSFVLTYAIFFIAFRHWAQKSTDNPSQPNQLIS